MRKVRTAAFAAASVVAACGASNNAPTSVLPQSANKADVLVTLDSVHHECMVTLSKEEHGNSIACGDIIPFLKDELRLPTGATFDVRTTQEVSKADSGNLRKSLSAAGYRSVGEP
jgi:hypothetical protein